MLTYFIRGFIYGEFLTILSVAIGMYLYVRSEKRRFQKYDQLVKKGAEFYSTAQFYFAMGSDQDATECYNKSMELFQQAEALFRKI